MQRRVPAIGATDQVVGRAVLNDAPVLDPVESFKRHVWVAPYYEDDIPKLVDTIGAERVLFGSDWPHAEGLAEPASFVEDLPGFAADDVRRIMRDNALALSVPQVA